MKIITISDTHTYENEVNIPNGDILIHCGDFMKYGSLKEFIRFAKNIGEISKRFKNVIMTCGNHDRIIEKEENLCRTILNEHSNNIHLLIDEEIIIDNLKFYGSPRTPEFFNWAFMYPRGTGKKYWDNIPNDVDILITHGPPYKKLDITGRPKLSDDINVGCSELLERVLEVKPMLHIFGHIHNSRGYLKENNITFINTAICDERNKVYNNPYIIEIDVNTKKLVINE